ncbi:MAG: hypothetical protein HQL72_05950 [Magnetococcales bacterium]|nr:hypothetical protein [Magnetococcales bacterium]
MVLSSIQASRKSAATLWRSLKSSTTEPGTPFIQADATTTRKHGGTGLGLTICQRLVDLMGETLTLESNVGAGGRFAFTLPLPERETTEGTVTSGKA